MSAGTPSTGRLVEAVVAGDQDRARAAVWSATARASGIECDMWIVSISNGPALTRSRGSRTSSGASRILCSSSFERTRPIVSGPP